MIQNDKNIFYGYLLLVLFFTSVHSPSLFLVALGGLFFVSKTNLYYFLKKTFLSVVFFSTVVSISYLFSGLFKKIDYDFLLLFNLRVFLLTYLSFYIFDKINIFKVFPKKIARIFVISFSQMYLNQRLLSEFKHGLASRMALFSYKRWLGSLQNIVFYFLNKSFHNSHEVTIGMRSRGFFDD